MSPLQQMMLVKLWKWEPENLPSVKHSARTAVAATVSFMIARLFRLPEAYWAAIATLVVMQSTLGATLLISVERIAATALGALVGAVLAAYFAENLLAFAGAVFAIGLLCAAVRMEKNAYRYASVTLAIIVLIPRANAAWIVALHRLHRSLCRNCCCTGARSLMAGAQPRIWETGRRLNAATSFASLDTVRFYG